MGTFNHSSYFFIPVTSSKGAPLTLDILGSWLEHARVSQSLGTCDQSKVRSHGRCQTAVMMAIQVAAQWNL